MLERELEIEVEGGAVLSGTLAVPSEASMLVLFAHGSGSGRHSPRNQAVAEVMHGAGIATVLFDLLTTGEEHSDRRTGHLRFDIPFLGARVLAAHKAVATQPGATGLDIGYFGASTGAAAALVAAAQADHVRAIVSRGGRPDLAGEALPRVRARTLLIVGERDPEVLALNRQAAERMTAATALEVIPGAGHLFEEPGALERVSALAAEWFSA